MRRLVGLAGGALLALLLFYLMALLVAPPEPEHTEIMMPTAISMVEAPQQDDAQPAPTSPSLPPPSPPPPPPAAAPVPVADAPSPVDIPEPQTPEVPAPDVTLDDALPELSEARPEPTPQPEPQPEPQPARETAAEAPPQPETNPGPAQPNPASQQPPRGTQAAPRDVGQLQPTSRVSPSYPMRARRRGLEGYVEVSFIIRPDGSVDTSSLRVIDAEPANVFDRAVREAVSQWRFPPADDVRRATQRIQFQLEG